MTIVCGIDLPAARCPALATAGALSAVLRERLVLAHALCDEVVLLDAERREHLLSAALRELERAAALVPPASARAGLRTEALHGGPHHALAALGRVEHASLLVLGARNRSSHLPGLGSTAERLALDSPVPTLVARDGAPFQAWAAGTRPLRVAVGLDPSRPDVSALPWVAHLRAAAPCDVLVAHVYYADELQRRLGGPPPPSLLDVAGETERRLLEEIRTRTAVLPGTGEIAVAVKPVLGRLADELVEIAAAHRADLLVVGAHHHAMPARLWSVPAGAVHLAPMSVAIVPATAPAPG
jgi:nucleotide-binding universal stress UspA family protein